MKRITFVLSIFLLIVAPTNAADIVTSRTASVLKTTDQTGMRTGDNSPSRINEQTTGRGNASLTTTPRAASTGASVTPRAASITQTRPVTNRAATTVAPLVSSRSGTTPTRTVATPIQRSTNVTSTTARATASNLVTDTRIGAAYDQCKSAYFTCMDQFCAAKNTNFQRCSCSDRIYDLIDAQTVMTEASQELTKFTENLDTVGMNAAQATAMKTASEGENALIGDSSAAKALLQAIMNSIKGTDATVGGKYSPLNTLSFNIDTTFASGFGDIGQAIAAYNGKNLYSIIYAQCREAVRGDCTDATLQRAVTAYLMAIEQDCNTVQKINDENKRKLTAAVREGSAMLDLARIENRQQHNAFDMTTCLLEVEKAILSEEVCGANYHRCLDNGKFIDITTGTPIAGVVNFYELEQILTFADGTSIADQRLAQIPANKPFVTNFESRVKKFAAPALDKCTEKADIVWKDFLDKALLDIYYAQRAKVNEIRMGCIDFVSACYGNAERSLTAAMSSLVNTATSVKPDMITLTDELCRNYVLSCDNMFTMNGESIIAQYIKETKTLTDTTTACRAVIQTCFNKFGGTDYVNFYNRYSGLFQSGMAWDWFTQGESRCWDQLVAIEACKNYPDEDNLEKARQLFGGFVKIGGKYTGPDGVELSHYPAGVATEVFNRVLDTLMNQCKNLYGVFFERQHLGAELCKVGDENRCPYRYTETVDTESWGVCSCEESLGLSSCNGTEVRCIDTTQTPCPNLTTP